MQARKTPSSCIDKAVIGKAVMGKTVIDKTVISKTVAEWDKFDIEAKNCANKPFCYKK
ncbi:hypothetical protein XSR1_260044 [Xenorhabdus szentirmaii DSM 16338]|uniref:Uncharacterized protein n=1 Tax=Xenorhabdus szentirmaii DSM 16338 TaxID=1427518 RepID=W1J0G9_9GAMM|nr:hypothetical protein XSR1_260044 [Xenorhabdus szentirmaii DSM 16338]